MLHNKTLSRPIKKGSAGEATWAVSYADFLMVLLSFFIVFFSVDQKSILHKIVTGIQTTSGASGTSQATTTTAGAAATQTQDFESGMAALAKIMPQSTVSQYHGTARLEIVLPDNIYSLGEYKAPEKIIAPIVEHLKKFESQISITVVGHSDVTGFQKNRPVIGTNNTTLAGVRAAYASIYFQNQLPGADVATQTSSNHARSTRSLTLYVEEKKVSP